MDTNKENKNKEEKLEINANVEGIHCSSCAQIIERTLKKDDLVVNVSVNPVSEQVKISYQAGFDIYAASKKLKGLGYTLIFKEEKKENDKSLNKDNLDNSELNSKRQALKKQRKKLNIFVPLALIVLINVIASIISQRSTMNWNNIVPESIFIPFSFVLASITYFYLGKNFATAALRFFKTAKANMDTLIGIGAGTAYFYSTIILLLPNLRTSLGLSEMYFFDVTIIVVVLVYLGKYLESLAKLKTGSVLQKLMNLQTKEALIERDGKEIKVSVKDLKLGDVMLVKTGEKIPSDGIISEGSASIDESLITGESLPTNKKVGEQVIGSTINRQGYIKVKVERIGEDTFLANIISAVEEAQNSKAPIQKIADKVSGIFVPIILLLSVLVLLTWLLLGPRFLPQGEVISVAITTFVSILAIACPCALGLATPTGIMVGLGIASKRGILIKNAEILEKLGKTNTIVFDKTGTITKGEVVLSEIESNLDEDKFLSIAASLENKSNHPLAKAIINAAKDKNINTQEVIDFNEEAGLGISGKIEGKKYYLGNDKFMFSLGIKNTPESATRMEKEGKTTIYLSAEKDNKKEVIGHLAVSDVIKEDAFEIISALKKMGIKTIMLSGDKENTAKYIARQAGIDEVIAEVSPLEKAEKIKSLKNEGQIITMVGDGINDAVALAASDIGLAMSNGSDIAIESADITILNGELAKIIQAIKISRLTLKKIKQNLFWAFFYNIIAIPIAAGAFYLSRGILLSPIIAASAMSLSSLSVIFNTLTMKKARI